MLQAFGTNDIETAEYLSRMIGDTTIYVESQNESRGAAWQQLPFSGNGQRVTAATTSETGRRLLFANEVRGLSRHRVLVFTKAGAPLLLDRVNYFRDPEFQGRYDSHPMFKRLK